MLLLKLRQEGCRDNHKRVRRLYRLEGLPCGGVAGSRAASGWPLHALMYPVLSVRMSTGRWTSCALRARFMRDTLSGGRAFRALTLVDAYTRECPAVEVDVSLGGTRVVEVLERLRLERGLPERITVDTHG